MNQAIINSCELLYKNKEAVQKAFKWDDDQMITAGSALITAEGKEADVEKLKNCAKILKENTGIFSDLRGYTKMLVLCKMALSSNPEEYLESLQQVLKVMKKVKWKEGSYKVLAAITILENAGKDVEKAVDDMMAIYKRMKKNHPWITGSDDLPFAAILAVSGLDKDALLEDMEKCYKNLKKKFHNLESVQSASQLLSVSDKGPDEKCAQLKSIYDSLKKNKHKFGKGRELAVLAALALLDENNDTLVEEIIEADKLLKEKKGFGNFLMGPEFRRMYATLMVLNAHKSGDAAEGALMSAVLGMVISMEITMMILISSSLNSAASSSKKD